MGAWGSGPFENDDALDFAGEIKTCDDLLEEASIEVDFIEADKASRLIIVGECVAAMRGHGHADMPEDLAARIADFGEPSLELMECAQESVSIVITNSELADLWADGPDRAGFNLAMTDLIERLGRPAQKSKNRRGASRKLTTAFAGSAASQWAMSSHRSV